MSTLPNEPSMRVPIDIYFFDTDAAGVVHNVAYLRMIEVARCKFTEAFGWSISEMMHGEYGCPVIVRTEIDYMTPAKIGDKVEIKVELVKMEKVRFWVASEMIRLSDGKTICKALQTMASVDLKTGRPVRLRSDWLEKWPELTQKGTISV
jgi:YbgC/YbaW family acyl-CoA thioester hydrolase